MLKNLAIVVASAESGAGRGVIIINYNYAFPLFAQQYDLRDRSRYHIVLEPSWSGYCTEDVLCYTGLCPNAVFVQGYERRDREFIDAWEPISLASRCPRTGGSTAASSLRFRPWKGTSILSWPPVGPTSAPSSVLSSPAGIAPQRSPPASACVGYPAGSTLTEIKRRAEWYGVSDQIEFHEFVPQAKVAELMNRTRST